MAHAKRTILLVEDEESITTPLAEALERDGFHTEVAHTVADGLERGRTRPARPRPARHRAARTAPGLDVCRGLRASSSVPIIILSARGEEADRVVGLELGADDYVVKPFSAREVIARDPRRPAALRSARAAPAGPIEIGRVRLDPARRTVTFGGEDVELARKEFDLLALLMQEAGTVVQRERLIDEVWDVNWFGSTKTLDVHVSALRKKLDPSYIHTVRGVGFRFASPEEVDVSLRLKLLAAFAYVLVLVLVALEIPLALSLSSRVDSEVRSQAASQAQVVAAAASARLGERAQLQSVVEQAGSDLGARVVVVDEQGRLLADSAGDGAPRRVLRVAPGDRGRARRRRRSRERGRATRSAPSSSTPPCRSSTRGARSGPCASRRATRR